jgi:hypothetical protein
MPGSNFQDFMLAVAVESCPFDAKPGVRAVGGFRPVEEDLVACVSDCELAAFVICWEADYKASELSFATGSVDMWLESATGSTVDVELIELSLYLSADKRVAANQMIIIP